MIEYITSLKWVDYFFFCLIDPRRLVNLISRKEGSPFLIGLIVVFFVSLFEIVSFSMLGSESNFFYFKISYGWIFCFLLLFLLIIIFSSLLDLASQLRNHDGNIKRIINLVNLSFFPILFVLPLVIIFVVINFAPVFFYILFTLLFHIWQAIIIIQGISETYHIGFGEALMIFLLPFIFIGLIMLFITILFFINIIGFISNL